MTRPLSVSLLLTATCLLGACDRGASEATAEQAPAEKTSAELPADAKPDEAAQPTDTKPAADTKAPALEPNSFKPPTREQAAEYKRSLQSHLDAGRKAVAAKDYATGIAELEQAIAINPLHAKSLGELGWAYFNAGKLDEAQDRLERGLKYADNDGTRGAISYNLGRVAEAKNDKALAIELYTRSLAVRPNDIVRERLTGLGGTPPVADAAAGTAQVASASHSQCGFENEGAPAANLCWARLAKLGQDVNDPAAEEHYKCDYGRTAIDAVGGAVAAGGESTVYELTIDGGKVQATVFSYLDYEMFDETFVLAIVIDDVLHTYPLVWVSHPGVGYADENLGELTLRSEDVVPGGRPEIVIEWSIVGHDMDPGIEEEELWGAELIGFVSVDGSAPQWLAALASMRERSYGPMTGWDGDDTPPAGETQTTKQAVEVSWSEGKLSVAARGEASAPVGSFAFADYPQRCPAEL